MRSGDAATKPREQGAPKDRPMAKNDRKFMQDNKPAQKKDAGDNALAAAFAKAGFKK
jgi:hypothetical protein